MIYNNECRFIGVGRAQIIQELSLLIIDKIYYADYDEGFTHAIIFDIENGKSNEVLSDMQSTKFASSTPGIIKTNIIHADKEDIGDRTTRAWLIGLGVSIKDIEGAHLQQGGYNIVNQVCHE